MAKTALSGIRKPRFDAWQSFQPSFQLIQVLEGHNDGSSNWVTAIHMEDLDCPNSWLWSGPVSIVIYTVSQSSISFFLSQIKKENIQKTFWFGFQVQITPENKKEKNCNFI